jgi:deferrochelatase/peroxidase EfeB
MTPEVETVLELDDIQSGVLYPRPTPYAASYALVRIDNRKAGREMLHRVIAAITPAANPSAAHSDTSVSIAFTFQGLKALAVPQDSLDGFPPEFQQGMAARAQQLGDVGENSPENWEKPLGTPDVHAVVAGLAHDAAHLEAGVERARKALREQPALKCSFARIVLCCQPSTNISDSRTGSAIRRSKAAAYRAATQGAASESGRVCLGLSRRGWSVAPHAQPEVLGRNGTYVAFRKLHQRVAAFRQYLRENSSSPEAEELLAAKIVGRWRSGCPLALSPERDDPELGADDTRNNDFSLPR